MTSSWRDYAKSFLLGLVLDVLLVYLFLAWGGQGQIGPPEVIEIAFGVAILWAAYLVIGLRRAAALVIAHYLWRGKLISAVVQGFRIAKFPRNFFAYDWQTFSMQVAGRKDVPDSAKLEAAGISGAIAATYSHSVVAGALWTARMDAAVLKYLEGVTIEPDSEPDED